MFHPNLTLELLNSMAKGNMLEHLGIEFTEFGGDYMKAKMPVDHRTTQPLNMLHGGASVALAETLGSMASNFCVDHSVQYCVGLEINANHIRSAMPGEFVLGTAKAIHIGKRTHVWEIRITNEKDKLVSLCRITNMVLDKK